MVVKTTIVFHIDSKIYRKRDYMKKPAAIFFALVLAVRVLGAIRAQRPYSVEKPLFLMFLML